MASLQRKTGSPQPQEVTPLLPPKVADAVEGRRGNSTVLFQILLCGFLVSLSFSVTQVPMVFVFREMSCDAFYQHRSEPSTSADPCGKREIEARMAREIAILAGSTTAFGLMNLLVTGWSIKRLGVKRALIIQVFWPAVRLAIQNIGVTVGSEAGIIIVQLSQILTIVGGPSGYVLALNSFITDVAGHEHRTSALGRLSGCMQVGSAVGFLVGGLIGEAFGIIAPFRITLILFLLSVIYVILTLPSISAKADENKKSEKPRGLLRLLGPLHIFSPQRLTLANGRTTKQFGSLTLGIGVFLGILATGYIVMLLQMYSIDEFGFSTSANGWLIFMYSSLRGLFLTLIFPRIISAGRKWLQPEHGTLSTSETGPDREPESPLDTISASEVEVTDPMDNETEPLLPVELHDEQETYEFDLLYARVSLLCDGVLTGLAVFVSKGWQMYVLAALLPLAAGTGSASKGSILQMIPSSERVDALSGLTLVENVARLSATTVFGFVFAALAEAGKLHLVFLCNAGIALLGFSVLCLSRFPPRGSKRI